MIEGRHYTIAMFCCHLSVEKALKAVLQRRTGALPPRLHDLRMLLSRTGLSTNMRLKRFIDKMAGLSVPTRYPGPLSQAPLGLRKRDLERAVRMTERVFRMVSAKLLGKRLLHCLEANGIRVEAMYLFGSHARNQGTTTSDIDVVVVSPTFATRGFWARCALVGEAIGELTEPFQVYPVTRDEFDHPEPGGFLESIRGEMRVLYTRRQPIRQGRSRR